MIVEEVEVCDVAPAAEVGKEQDDEPPNSVGQRIASNCIEGRVRDAADDLGGKVMTKKALAISLGILGCLFLAVLPAAAEDGPESAPGFFQSLYQAILEWIAPPEGTDDLTAPPPSAPPASTMSTPPQPEIGTMIPPGG